MSSPSELPPVVDLCAASGLFARAFKDIGFPIARGFELDPRRAAAWEANVGAPCEVQDVTELKPEDLRRHADRDGRLVVIGGFPCQTFSTNNQYATHDTTLRDTCLALLDVVKPTSCAIENVRAGWKGVKGVSFVRDCDVGGVTIRERGFYGAPPIAPTHAQKPARRLDGVELQKWRGWGEVIPDAEYVADFGQQDDFENRHVLNVKHASHPCWTVTTKPYLVFWRGQERKSLRWETPDDAAALQGFPPGWVFPATTTAKLGCIGDAVPLAMGRSVARSVRAEILGPEVVVAPGVGHA